MGIYDYIRGSVPFTPNNQAHLPNEWKVRARSGGALKAEDAPVDPPEFYKVDKKGEEDFIFEGLYSKAHMAPFMTDNKKDFDQLKALAECYLDKVMAIITKEEAGADKN